MAQFLWLTRAKTLVASHKDQEHYGVCLGRGPMLGRATPAPGHRIE